MSRVSIAQKGIVYRCGAVMFPMDSFYVHGISARFYDGLFPWRRVTEMRLVSGIGWKLEG